MNIRLTDGKRIALGLYYRGEDGASLSAEYEPSERQCREIAAGQYLLPCGNDFLFMLPIRNGSIRLEYRMNAHERHAFIAAMADWTRIVYGEPRQ